MAAIDVLATKQMITWATDHERLDLLSEHVRSDPHLTDEERAAIAEWGRLKRISLEAR